MTLPLHLLSSAVLVLAGLAWLALLQGARAPARPWLERLSLAYALGLVWCVLLQLGLGAAGLGLGPASLLLAQLPLLAAAALRLRRQPAQTSPAPTPEREPVRALHVLLVLWIASKLAYVLYMNLHDLRRSDDAFKVNLLLARDLFGGDNPWTYQMLRGYPKSPGLLLSWFCVLRGVWDEYALNLPYLNLLLCLLGLFYANLRRVVARTPALLATWVLVSFPLLLNHAVMVGYADLPMTLFLCAAGLYAWRFAAGGEGADLRLALVFALWMPFVKFEGLIPYLLLVAGVLVSAALWRSRRVSQRRLGLLWLLAVVAGLALPFAWVALRGEAVPPGLSAEVWERVRPGNHLAEIGDPLVLYFLDSNWMLLGSLLPLVLLALTLRAGGRAEWFLGLLGLLLVTAFLYVFLCGGAYRFLVNGMTVNRSYLQLVPLLLFAVCALGWPRAAQRGHGF